MIYPDELQELPRLDRSRSRHGRHSAVELRIWRVIRFCLKLQFAIHCMCKIAFVINSNTKS